MLSPVSWPAGIVANLDTTFNPAQSPVIKITLTRQGHPTTRTRILVPANQAVPGEVVLDTRVANLESLQLVVRLSGSSMTNPMHGVARVAGQLHTLSNLMTIGTPTRVHSFSMISIRWLLPKRDLARTVLSWSSSPNPRNLRVMSILRPVVLVLPAIGEHFAKMETSASDPT